MTVAAVETLHGTGNNRVYAWAAMETGDVGAPVDAGEFPDKTFNFRGTAVTAASLEGSNDGSNWFPLSDLSGSAVALTAAGTVVIRENPRYVRPKVTTGTAVVVTLCASK